jgi:predicted transcriptional regulator
MDNKPVTGRKDGYHSVYLAAVDEGLVDAEAKRMVPFAKVWRWLLSWGTDQKLPPPECR